MSERRVAVLLPPDVASINDTQRAFGPGCENLPYLVADSDFVEVDVERNRLGPELVEIRLTSGWQATSGEAA